jgi:hypothetical protein
VCIYRNLSVRYLDKGIRSENEEKVSDDSGKEIRDRLDKQSRASVCISVSKSYIGSDVTYIIEFDDCIAEHG